jgi:hypothetical protein
MAQNRMTYLQGKAKKLLKEAKFQFNIAGLTLEPAGSDGRRLDASPGHPHLLWRVDGTPCDVRLALIWDDPAWRVVLLVDGNSVFQQWVGDGKQLAQYFVPKITSACP